MLKSGNFPNKQLAKLELNACGLPIPDPGWPAMPLLGETHDISAVERKALITHISKYW